MKKYLAVLPLLFAQAALGQISPTTETDTAGRDGRQESSTKPPQPFAVSGYAEVYYGYDFNRPGNNTRPPFVYSHNRHGEVTANLAFLKGAYNGARVRAALALMAGTYSNANLAAEPGVLKNIFEANAGVKLSRSRELWIDAGIMASHIGFESAVTKDCWTLTRSIVADNSPYYISGAKLAYTTPDGKWYLAGLFLNGWQRIQRPDGNSTPAFGTQLTYKPNGKTTLNWSTFLGNDKPDSVHQTRMYHNLYAILTLTDRFGITAGFDYGMEQGAGSDDEWRSWYTPTVILRYKTSAKTALALRGEYYSDEHGVIIADGSPDGFKTSGVSLNFDYAPVENVLFRVEGKSFFSNDDIFLKGGTELVSTSPVLTTSLSVAF